MSISSEITRIKNNIASAYTALLDKGATLPTEQNSANLAPTIKSISGGGGDTIFLENTTGMPINTDQKVLYSLGSIGSATSTTFTHNSSNTNSLLPILFFDNSAFLNTSRDSYTGYLHTFADDKWNVTSDGLYTEWGVYTAYIYHNNGIISSGSHIGGTNQNGYIYTKAGRTVLPSSNIYVGEYNGVHYCMNSDGYSVNVYNIHNNTVGEEKASLYESSRYLYWGQIVSNKCMLINTNNNFRIFDIDSSGTFTVLNTSHIIGYPLYATGGDVGDYIFTTENKDAYLTWAYSSSNLFCYQIQSDYSLLQVSVPELKIFENTPCFICYDNRNSVLNVGTAKQVYFYQFHTTTKTFTQLEIDINSYPDNPHNVPFRTMVSPDKTIVVIISDFDYVNIYKLTTAYHRIVENSAYNYDLQTSFTGFATGNIDANGKYEVKTVLPDKVNVTLNITPDPDSIKIYGEAV